MIGQTPRIQIQTPNKSDKRRPTHVQIANTLLQYPHPDLQGLCEISNLEFGIQYPTHGVNTGRALAPQYPWRVSPNWDSELFDFG